MFQICYVTDIADRQLLSHKVANLDELKVFREYLRMGYMTDLADRQFLSYNDNSNIAVNNKIVMLVW